VKILENDLQGSCSGLDPQTSNAYNDVARLPKAVWLDNANVINLYRMSLPGLRQTS
jgi:hypothetical protein